MAESLELAVIRMDCKSREETRVCGITCRLGLAEISCEVEREQPALYPVFLHGSSVAFIDFSAPPSRESRSDGWR